MRFLLSARSAYVSGQVIEIGPAPPAPALDWERPMSGKVALVTGASRGIGAAIASTLARDGAHVLGVDVPALGADLDAVTGALGGSSLALDITTEDAPQRIAEHLRREHGGVDAVVHNAGITRDKTLGRMDRDALGQRARGQPRGGAADHRRADLGRRRGRARVRRTRRVRVLDQRHRGQRRTEQLRDLEGRRDRPGATPTRRCSPRRGATINAVAPGFIETQMTADMPLALREAGRRMNSLSQGGLPVDVAETIAWLASPASGAVNGNVVRVCGQSLLGA